MVREEGQVNEISNDQRQTISIMMVMSGVATDPTQMAVITGSFFNYVLSGLVGKYGLYLNGLNPDIFDLVNNNIIFDDYAVATYRDTGEPVPETNIPFTIQYAIRLLQMSNFHWGQAVPYLLKAQSDLQNICVAEDLLDYKLMAERMRDQMDRMQQLTEDSEDERTEDEHKPFLRATG